MCNDTFLPVLKQSWYSHSNSEVCRSAAGLSLPFLWACIHESCRCKRVLPESLKGRVSLQDNQVAPLCICLPCPASLSMCSCKMYMYAVIHCSAVFYALSVKKVFFNTTMTGQAEISGDNGLT